MRDLGSKKPPLQAGAAMRPQRGPARAGAGMVVLWSREGGGGVRHRWSSRTGPAYPLAIACFFIDFH